MATIQHLRTACPGAEDLYAFWQGRLPEAALVVLAGHLSECTRCEAALETLRLSDDAVVDHLRECQSPPTDATRGWQRLERRAGD